MIRVYGARLSSRTAIAYVFDDTWPGRLLWKRFDVTKRDTDETIARRASEIGATLRWVDA